jgi:hypothetical protein
VDGDVVARMEGEHEDRAETNTNVVADDDVGNDEWRARDESGV